MSMPTTRVQAAELKDNALSVQQLNAAMQAARDTIYRPIKEAPVKPGSAQLTAFGDTMKVAALEICNKIFFQQAVEAASVNLSILNLSETMTLPQTREELAQRIEQESERDTLVKYLNQFKRPYQGAPKKQITDEQRQSVEPNEAAFCIMMDEVFSAIKQAVGISMVAPERAA